MFECKVLANSLTARSLKTETVLMWKVRQVHGMSDRYNGMSDKYNGMSDRHTTFSCGMSDMCKYFLMLNVRQVQWNVRHVQHFLM